MSGKMEESQKSYEDVEKEAMRVYSKLEKDNIPSVFKHPEDFVLKESKRDMEVDPVKLLYRTSNSEYGSFAPSILEMPTIYRGKTENLLKEQNYVNYRSSRMNVAGDPVNDYFGKHERAKRFTLKE